MSRWILLLVSLVLVPFLASCSEESAGEGLATQDEFTSGSDDAGAADGRAIYGQNCASCHGSDGGGGVGPQIGDGRVVEKYTEEQHIQIVTNGRNQMPSFASVLSASEIQAVVTYERTQLGR